MTIVAVQHYIGHADVDPTKNVAEEGDEQVISMRDYEVGHFTFSFPAA